MAEISNQTLMIAIQAVDAEIRTLRESLAEGEAIAEEYDMLEDLQEAADDLARAYSIAVQTALNLPPYDELVFD